jgi:Mn-dependent DtxR family transcriptional regulator
MKLYESGENYLETIYLLKKSKGAIRSIDIAVELGYTKPSISRVIGNFKKEGYITVDKGGYIELTEKGLNTAENIYQRHTVLTRFFCAVLDIGAEMAEREACRVEHVISEELFSEIKKYVNAQTK